MFRCMFQRRPSTSEIRVAQEFMAKAKMTIATANLRPSTKAAVAGTKAGTKAVAPAARTAVPARRAAASAAALRLRATLGALAWDSPSGAFLIFRLLLVLPFPARVLRAGVGAGAASVRHLGELFDAVCVRNCHLRDVADNWTVWAGRELISFVRIWARSVSRVVADRPAA
jgi:hypothetical protein